MSERLAREEIDAIVKDVIERLERLEREPDSEGAEEILFLRSCIQQAMPLLPEPSPAGSRQVLETAEIALSNLVQDKGFWELYETASELDDEERAEVCTFARELRQRREPAASVWAAQAPPARRA